jgi:hypothetical protein
MDKIGIMKKIDAIISPIYMALMVGTGVFFAVLLARLARHTSKSESTLDISQPHWLQGQESPKSSAIRLNAIWLRERSQA